MGQAVAVGVAQPSLLARKQDSKVGVGALEDLAELRELPGRLVGECARLGKGVGQGQIGAQIAQEGVSHSGVLTAQRTQRCLRLARVLDDGGAGAGQLRLDQRCGFHQLHGAAV